tara:strand:+ start:27827 stop:29347 length:1521 start_codon:yes stop_codon:yes gene_type:complete
MTLQNKIIIPYAEPLHPVFTKPKRMKIVYGGRGSTKTTGIAGYILDRVSNGRLWCCGREAQNSIEESVHRTLESEIARLQLPGFDIGARGITHESGGRIFYVGLARNVANLKSMLTGIDGLWIEEGEGVSRNSLEIATGSVRLSPQDTERMIAGEPVDFPEIIITMNRGSTTSAISERYLKRAQGELELCGYYEDDAVMIVRMNYTDVPQIWFKNSGLEDERLDDYEKMSRAEYDHKWLGAAFDEVDGSIIKPEWYDACIDAHKLPHLVEIFKPHGAIICAHDPFDDGQDAGGFATRHGSIVLEVKQKNSGEIDVVCDWATGEATKANADWFVWDGDGMGTGLKRQINIAFNGTKTQYHIFKGSLSGSGQDNANKPYMFIEDEDSKNRKSYKQVFKNNRAQYYSELARRIYNTYRCVVKKEYVDPEDMISFASEGIENADAFRSEICRIPRKDNPNGLEQIMSKADMKTKYKIPSPNAADAVMMCLYAPPTVKQQEAFSIPNQKRF